jgi:uncharacterized membrane protein
MATIRPVIRDLERSRIDVVLEILAGAGVFALIAIAAVYYPRLPDSIPTHYNFSGEPDAWGAKTGLLVTPLIGAVLYAALTVLSRFPHKFNYPWAITESNARRQYILSRRMLSAVKLVLVFSFSYITWSTIRTALGNQMGLSPFFTILQIPILAVIIGHYVMKARRAA